MSSSFITDKTIIVDHLSFGDDLKDISFTIQKGEFAAIIGDSDSGLKSVLKIISGLEKPSSGFVSVLGFDPYLKTQDYLKNITFLSRESSQILKNSPPIDSLEITKEIYGLSDREFNKNLTELTQFIKDPLLLDSLIFKPKVLLLDKINLDLDSIYEYNKKYESTNLITSEKIDHLMNLVRRVIILDKGSIVFDGAIDEVITKFAKEKVIKAKLSSTTDVKLFTEFGSVKKYDFPYLHISAPRTTVSFTAAEMIQNLPINNLIIEEISVEEIIKNIKNGI